MTLALARTPAVYSAAPAPAHRTLLDVLAETTARYPDEAAIDAGGTVLTYRRLAEEVDVVRRRLADAGIGVGDRVGVRISSGTAELYVAILAVLSAGAAYVPVDADDPEERAELVFGEAGVCAVLGDDGAMTTHSGPIGTPGTPGPDDDAWIIFTSVRRLLRGDVARLAARRLPGPGAPGAGTYRGRPRAVAPGAAHHDRLHRPNTRRALAAGGP